MRNNEYSKLFSSSIAFKILVFCALVSVAFVAGGCSVASLRCGTGPESSYVELAGVPESFPAQAQAYADLCGFASEEGVR